MHEMEMDCTIKNYCKTSSKVLVVSKQCSIANSKKNISSMTIVIKRCNTQKPVNMVTLITRKMVPITGRAR